ncbi:MAG: hypothetical protein QXD13_01475 [Candidatus Pacearchaeota archaeon]
MPNTIFLVDGHKKGLEYKIKAAETPNTKYFANIKAQLSASNGRCNVWADEKPVDKRWTILISFPTGKVEVARNIEKRKDDEIKKLERAVYEVARRHALIYSSWLKHYLRKDYEFVDLTIRGIEKAERERNKKYRGKINKHH